MSHAYERLTPDLILDAVATLGHEPDGHLLALNSYENRVLQVGLAEATPLIAKFYRPGRWSDQQIIEEHLFSLACADADIPVVPPWQDSTTRTLFAHQGFRFALYPRRGGRAPELEDLDHLEWIGRLLGRIHLLGASADFHHRPALNCQTLGWQARSAVLASGHLPRELETAYREASDAVLLRCETAFAHIKPRMLRLHGDCHPGNILWTDDGPHFVDLDDARSGPAIQDLWMLLQGERQDMSLQLSVLLEGYRTFCDFDTREIALIEVLRSLRLLHYSAWLSTRWEDPAFPRAFPWFGERHYWEGHINDLRQQLLRLDEPPLVVY